MRAHRAWALSPILLALTGCLGDGGTVEGSNTNTPAPGAGSAVTSVTVSGVAAVGAPLGGATVSLKCQANTIPDTTTDASTGAWSQTVPSDSFPCVAEARQGSTVLHSVLDGAGGGKQARLNITTLTELLVARLAGSGKTPAQFFGAPVFPAITAQALADAIAALRSSLPEPIRTQLGDANPFRVDFQADGSGHDAVLDAFRQALAQAGLTLQDVAASVAAGDPLMPLIVLANKSASAGDTLTIDLSGKTLPANQPVGVKFGSTAATGTVNASGTAVSVTVPAELAGLTVAVTVDGAYGSILLAVASSGGGGDTGGGTGGGTDPGRLPQLFRSHLSFSDIYTKVVAAEVADLDGFSVTGQDKNGAPCTVSLSGGALSLAIDGSTATASFNGGDQDTIDNNMGNGSPYLSLMATDGSTLATRTTVSVTLGRNSTAVAATPGVFMTGNYCKLPATLPADLTALTVADTIWATNKAKFISATAYTGKGKRENGQTLDVGRSDCSATVSETSVTVSFPGQPDITVPISPTNPPQVNKGTASNGWLPYFVSPFQAVKAPTLWFRTSETVNSLQTWAEVYAYNATDGSTQVTGMGEIGVGRQITPAPDAKWEYRSCVIQQSANGVYWAKPAK